jgi:hypothetical protein
MSFYCEGRSYAVLPVWRKARTDGVDPLTGSRGLVPRQDFEEFNKGGINKSSTRPPSQEAR